MGSVSVRKTPERGSRAKPGGVAKPKAPTTVPTIQKIAIGVTTASGMALSSPLAAHAATTPSLRNLLYSVLAGGSVLFVLFGAVSIVAQFDPVNRK